MLTWEYPPRIIGGIASHVYHLCKFLSKKGVKVHVVTCDFPGSDAEERVENVLVHRVDCSRAEKTGFLLWTYYMNSKFIERCEEIFETEAIDIIHAHDWIVGRAALKLQRVYDIPLIATIHATELGRGQGRLGTNYRRSVDDIESALIQNSDGIICCSDYMLNQLRRRADGLGGNSTKEISVIPNAVDVSDFGKRADPLSNPTIAKLHSRFWILDGKIVLFVGRLVKEKGLDVLIDSFELLLLKQNHRANASHHHGGSKVSLLIVGEGQLKDRLIKDVEARGLSDSIIFTGFVDQGTLVSLYNASSVFVVPSRYEPFGIVALEAMASRVPLIVSNVGGLPEIVKHGVTGLKFSSEDSVSLCRAIQRLLSDESLSERLKINAYNLVRERFNWTKVSSKTLQSYKRVIAGGERLVPIRDESYLTDRGVLQLLFTLGATKKESARSAHQIADFISAPEISVKVILGRLASQGYISGSVESGTTRLVRYHLMENGIINACAELS